MRRNFSTSHKQMHVNLVRGTPGQMPPPVQNMDEIWSPQEKASVESSLSASIIGSAEMVREGLKALVAATQADELIINSMIYDHVARLRSYDIVSRVRRD